MLSRVIAKNIGDVFIETHCSQTLTLENRKLESRRRSSLFKRWLSNLSDSDLENHRTSQYCLGVCSSKALSKSTLFRPTPDTHEQFFNV